MGLTPIVDLLYHTNKYKIGCTCFAWAMSLGFYLVSVQTVVIQKMVCVCVLLQITSFNYILHQDFVKHFLLHSILNCVALGYFSLLEWSLYKSPLENISAWLILAIYICLADLRYLPNIAISQNLLY